MRFIAIAVCVAATTAALEAKPSRGTQASRQAPVLTVRPPLQMQTGPKSAGAQPFKPLQLPVVPHRPESGATPFPLATPEFNPLKRRHMAMPGLPEPDLAF